MRRLLPIVCLAAVISVPSYLAAGISVPSQFYNGLQQWSDNSADWLYRSSTNPIGDGDTIVEVGDVLIAIFDVATAEDLVNGGPKRNFGDSGVNEFTGITAIEVISGPTGSGPFSWVFGPVSAANKAKIAANAALPTIGAKVGSWSAGTMIAFYQDAAIDYTRLGATVDSVAVSAIGGTSTPLFQFGFTGAGTLSNGATAPGAGQGWIASATSSDIGAIGSTPPPANGGTLNFGVSLIPGTNMTNLQFLPVATIFAGSPAAQMGGSGNLLGTAGVATPYDAFDNFDLVVNAVPEPVSLITWAGLTGIGVVFAARRRRES